MKTIHFSRRQFLQTSAGVASGSLAASLISLHREPFLASAVWVAASDGVGFGIVGVGREGTNLLPTAIQLPGVECVAACVLYAGRHELAKKIVGNPTPTPRRYKELL